MRNLIKLGVLIVVATCALNTASGMINEMVIEVNKREKTIADALIAQQVQEMFKEADKEIAKVQEEEQVEIKVEEVQIKPPLPPKPEKPKKSEKVEEVAKEAEEAPVALEGEQMAEGDEIKEDAATNSQMDMATLYALTPEEMTLIGEYLVDNYFLFGYKYYQEETDPTRYARKKLASDMEDQIIASLQEGFGLVNDLKGLNLEKIKGMREQAVVLAETFKETFKEVGKQGEEFDAIYESGNAFFNTYINTLQQGESTYTLLEQTTNKAMVLPILLKQMNETLLPGLKEVFNQGFTLKEKTNKIYVEGIDASFLLTPEEVMDVIENPYSILPPRPEVTPPSEETPPSE
ncbi:MAG: hypothetical protein RSA51_08605, partial [Niameybacter sp.]